MQLLTHNRHIDRTSLSRVESKSAVWLDSLVVLRDEWQRKANRDVESFAVCSSDANDTHTDLIDGFAAGIPNDGSSQLIPAAFGSLRSLVASRVVIDNFKSWAQLLLKSVSFNADVVKRQKH